MNFKEFAERDLQIFIDSNEFAAAHTIDGRTLNVIVDNDRLMQRSKKEFDGISVGELLYFVSAEDYGPPPKVDAVQKFDNKLCEVFDVRVDEGMYEIILRRYGA
ncbi:MAG: hypothetical protein K0R80_1608 [Clostridia bacterium]|jgi:hypothetical protein|nr:hypothetical protein [Clostridia bacterium]